MKSANWSIPSIKGATCSPKPGLAQTLISVADLVSDMALDGTIKLLMADWFNGSRLHRDWLEIGLLETFRQNGWVLKSIPLHEFDANLHEIVRLLENLERTSEIISKPSVDARALVILTFVTLH